MCGSVVGAVFTGKQVAHNRSGLGSFEHHGNTNNSGILLRYILAHDTITKSWTWKDLEVSWLQRCLPDVCGYPVSQAYTWMAYTCSLVHNRVEDRDRRLWQLEAVCINRTGQYEVVFPDLAWPT